MGLREGMKDGDRVAADCERGMELRAEKGIRSVTQVTQPQ